MNNCTHDINNEFYAAGFSTIHIFFILYSKLILLYCLTFFKLIIKTMGTSNKISGTVDIIRKS